MDLASIDRSTKHGFVKYMQANPVYFEQLFGEPATETNIIKAFRFAMRARKRNPFIPVVYEAIHTSNAADVPWLHKDEQMNCEIKFVGLSEVINNLDQLAKSQLPYAMSRTLNETAKQVKTELVRQMSIKLDRPTPYTRNALYMQAATKNNLVAEIGYKGRWEAGKGNPPVNWMYPLIEGVPRNTKRYEAALRRIGILPHGMAIVPGDACPLDAYGNIPRGLIIQILSYFRAFGEQGYTANITPKQKAKLRKGSKKQDLDLITLSFNRMKVGALFSL